MSHFRLKLSWGLFWSLRHNVVAGPAPGHDSHIQLVQVYKVSFLYKLCKFTKDV